MLTAIIASHNGERTVADVLEAHSRLIEPRGGWRLVFVDNCSTDRTAELVRAYEARLPLTLISEPQRGKNRALIRALEHVIGDLVVFSDDDATPKSDWLVQLRNAADAHPDFDIFSGAILPRWEVPPDPWILDYVDLGVCFSVTSPELREGPIAPDLVWGPNMAIRSRVFDLGFQFDPLIGPSGSSYAMGSETEFTIRLGVAGFKSWFCPRAIVHHFVRKNQMTETWILGRAVRCGRGIYRRELKRTTAHPRLVFGVPWPVHAQIAAARARLAASALASREERFRRRWELNYWLGCRIEAKEAFGARSSFAPAMSLEDAAEPPSPADHRKPLLPRQSDPD